LTPAMVKPTDSESHKMMSTKIFRKKYVGGKKQFGRGQLPCAPSYSYVLDKILQT